LPVLGLTRPRDLYYYQGQGLKVLYGFTYKYLPLEHLLGQLTRLQVGYPLAEALAQGYSQAWSRGRRPGRWSGRRTGPGAARRAGEAALPAGRSRTAGCEVGAAGWAPGPGLIITHKLVTHRQKG